MFLRSSTRSLQAILIGTFGAKLWVKVGYIKKTILYPLIFASAILGSYSIKKSIFDVGTYLVFGLVGWMCKKFDYPSSPIVLGLVLSKLIETNYIHTLMGTGAVGFVQRPLTVILFIISIVAMVYPIVSPMMKNIKKSREWYSFYICFAPFKFGRGIFLFHLFIYN